MNSFPKARWMGRVTGREGVVWESSLGAQALVLWKALHVSPWLQQSAASLEDQRGFYHPVPQPDQRSQSATCEMPRVFCLHLCCFSLAFSTASSCAAMHPHTSKVLGQSFGPFYPTCCRPLSSALRALDHSHGHCFGFRMRSNCYHCVNHSFCLSLPLLPLFCGF